MRSRLLFRSKTLIGLMIVTFIGSMLPWGTAWAANPLPLSQIPIPEPPNLAEFVKDKAAAIKLGKALFWDMQVGSEGGQACASCHYRAGADPLDIRAKNQLNPGSDGTFQVLAGPNLTLTPADFPFHQVSPVDSRLASGQLVTRSKNDVVGSQGVELEAFQNINIGSAIDTGLPVNDPVFGHIRQVTGRNTPPAVNAVFNYVNFWDGRANNIFNGSSPIGPLDTEAGVWINLGGVSAPVLGKVKVAIPNASLASQATGPPLSSVEMSYAARTWPELGKKMLGLAPLAQQLVSPTDSVLGGLSKSPANGITATYDQMIKDAFQAKYWAVGGTIQIGTQTFSQMEANFSLFWGLAIQLYEATLVSDQTPFDLWLAANSPSNGGGIISQDAATGFGIFQSKCAMCHVGSELTDASLTQAFIEGLIITGDTNNSNAISDQGFHNIGVRLTADDIGRGGVINFDLSFARQAIDQANGTIPFAAPQPLPNGATAGTPVAVNGSFKTPSLRNIALTAPYMHNGSMATLGQVVEFYSRGGNFANLELAKEMNAPTGLSATDRAKVVAFLNALTDPRVANETAPFDHPELRIPAGGAPAFGDGLITLPAKGAGTTTGRPLYTPVDTRTFSTTLPKATITGAPTGNTNLTSATLTIGGTNVVQYMYQLDTGTLSAATPVATPITLTGLARGTHIVAVLGIDVSGNQQLAANATEAIWTVIDNVAPAMTVDNPTVKTNKDTQTITGTVEVGSTVAVNAGPGVTVGPVTVSGNTFSCKVSGLKGGANNITVTATDAAGNVTTTPVTVTAVKPDGCVLGGTVPGVADAIKALRIAVKLDAPTADEALRGDCAPLVNGVPAPDGKVNSADALVILKKAVGLVNF